MSENGQLRCAAWTRDFGVDPIATVGSYRSFLLVDWPLPWPRDLAELDSFEQLGPALRAAQCRLQAVVVPRDADECRLALYRTSHEKFTGYELLETKVPFDCMAETAVKLLEDAEVHEYPPSTHMAAKEILVCTHGKRDRCCGSQGTSLAMELLSNTEDRFSDVRIARTSHTGGHRFAPTSLVFPEGTGWAFCDIDLIERIARREGPIASVLPHYRGCAGLASRGLQALERSVLAELGWTLFDLSRQGHDTGDGMVSLDVAWPSGDIASWEATVAEGRRVPVPDCGRPIGEAKKVESEIVLDGFRRTK